MLFALVPLSVVGFAVDPDIDALSMRFVVLVTAKVGVAGLESLITHSVALIFAPESFEEPTVEVSKDSAPLSLISCHVDLAMVLAVLVLLNMAVLFFGDCCKVEEVADHLIIFESALSSLSLTLHRLNLFLQEKVGLSRYSRVFNFYNRFYSFPSIDFAKLFDQ